MFVLYNPWVEHYLNLESKTTHLIALSEDSVLFLLRGVEQEMELRGGQRPIVVGQP